MMEDKNIKDKVVESKSKMRNFVNTRQEVYKAPASVLETTVFDYGSMKYAAVFTKITNDM